MIITVTMNPAIDKTVEIEKLERGGLNRISKVECDAGGKGINVSKTLHALGGRSIAVGFAAGSTGKMIERTLEETGIHTDFIYTDGETRTNTKVVENDGTVTELNETGAAIKEKQLKELLEKIEGYADKNTLFVIAGSIPKGLDKSIYADIIRLVHGKGAKVLLDADGEAFAKAIEEKPDIIKPNREELAQYAGADKNMSFDELVLLARKLNQKGIGTVAVTMGKDGAVLVRGGCCIMGKPIVVDAHSTVGAGDAFVAALAYAWEQGLEDDDTMNLCMAASAGAVTTTGTKPPEKELVDQLKNRSELIKL